MWDDGTVDYAFGYVFGNLGVILPGVRGYTH